MRVLDFKQKEFLEWVYVYHLTKRDRNGELTYATPRTRKYIRDVLDLGQYKDSDAPLLNRLRNEHTLEYKKVMR